MSSDGAKTSQRIQQAQGGGDCLGNVLRFKGIGIAGGLAVALTERVRRSQESQSIAALRDGLQSAKSSPSIRLISTRFSNSYGLKTKAIQAFFGAVEERLYL